MDTSSAVYHFTCTARLPWIVEAGELRPGRNQIGDFPLDFLWATTSRQGDRTASAMLGYLEKKTALVRLTLHAEDFEPWPAIIERFSQWTRDHVRGLEAAAHKCGEVNFSGWRARAEPLPLSRVIAAEAKTYRGNWQTIEPYTVLQCSDPKKRGTLVNGTVYASIRWVQHGKPTMYFSTKLSLDEWRAEQW